jgi:hypothetical protein
MANYYIGTINSNNLANKGFNTKIGKLSLQTCLISANSYNNNQGTNYNYIAFLPDNPSDNSLQSDGTCTMGNSTYNPLIDNVGNMIDAYRVYKVDSCVDDSCIKSESKSVLRDTILQQQNIIDSSNTNIDKLEVRLSAIDDNIDDATASSRYAENKNNEKTNKMSNQQKEQLDQYQDLLHNIRLSHKSSKQLLSDKNRLIASTSSNIQTSTDKLEDLNNKINEANQEISKNNIDFEKKNKIITSLQAMITIFFILLLIMIIYYGAIYTRDAYPETYNSITNQINNSFSNLSSLNSFNNY